MARVGGKLGPPRHREGGCGQGSWAKSWREDALFDRRTRLPGARLVCVVFSRNQYPCVMKRKLGLREGQESSRVT